MLSPSAVCVITNGLAAHVFCDGKLIRSWRRTPYCTHLLPVKGGLVIGLPDGEIWLWSLVSGLFRHIQTVPHHATLAVIEPTRERLVCVVNNQCQLLSLEGDASHC